MMDSNRKVESIFIASLIVLTIGLGIVCSLYDMNTVVSSVCFAIGITSLVYWFLGGISDASFNMGYLKLGGSIAALLGSFYLISTQFNNKVADAIIKDKGSLYVMDGNLNPQKLLVKQGGYSVDSIEAFDHKFFKNTQLTVDSNLRVYKKNGIIFGQLNKKDLSRINFFSRIKNASVNGELVKATKKKFEECTFGLKVKMKKITGDSSASLIFNKNNEEHTVNYRNKQVKVLEVNKAYYLISVTQCNFGLSLDSSYMQLFIKPLDVE